MTCVHQIATSWWNSPCDFDALALLPDLRFVFLEDFFTKCHGRRGQDTMEELLKESPRGNGSSTPTSHFSTFVQFVGIYLKDLALIWLRRLWRPSERGLA